MDPVSSSADDLARRRHLYAQRAPHGTHVKYADGCRCRTCTKAELARCVADQRRDDNGTDWRTLYHKRTRRVKVNGRQVDGLHTISLDDVVSVLPAHLVEWDDPTADAVLARLAA